VIGTPSIARKIAARLRAVAQRMRRESTRASAMLEFGIVAPVFFIMLMGIIENGIIYFGSSTLQYATDEAARQVRTGQAQAASMTQAQFRTLVCNNITPLLACDSNLQIDMETTQSGTFAGAAYGSPTDANGNLNASLSNYQPGVACNVVLVRAFYTWKVLTPGLSVFLTNITGGYHLITATTAFRNEPFNVAVAGC
jgi:Flp pilus assembly protein TadG